MNRNQSTCTNISFHCTMQTVFILGINVSQTAGSEGHSHNTVENLEDVYFKKQK